MDPEEKRIRKYENALSLLFYEGEIAWQINIVFIALNVGLGTLISSQIKDGTLRYGAPLIVYSILGILITCLWLGTFSRNNSYYSFRMAQAREIEPEDWRLIRDRGYKFSRGEKVVIDSPDIEPEDKVHRLSKFEKWASNKRALKYVIYILIGAYIILLFFSLVRTLEIHVCI